MEDMVAGVLDEFLADNSEVCNCTKCRLDMMAKTLNKLPAKYVVSDKGRVFTKLQETEVQLKADIFRELTKAAVYVKKNPRH